MSGVAPREDETGRMTGARGEFVGSLPRRLEMLRSSLAALEELPADSERQNGLLRRLHALGSSSRVLGFASVAEALGEAEKLLRSALMTGKPLPLSDVARTLDLLPSLASDQASERDSLVRAWPISVLVFGPQSIADAIATGPDVNVECERTEDPERARELARILGPDVAVLDADRRGARELCQVFAEDQLFEPVPLLVIGSFEGAETAASYLELGAARVLTRPVGPDGLWRAVSELRERALSPRAPRQPLGQLTVSGLAERIAEELKRGLVDAVEGNAQATPVGFGEGADVMAAVWGAVARVRELVTLRSQGMVRFQPTGPGGAVPLGSWSGDERRAGERSSRAARDLEGVSMEGRRIVVADDDPAVVWFMSGLLKAVGAEVTEAHDGRRALELTTELWPDAVISDVLMPELDGFSLCHEIKRDVLVRDTPVILLSWKEDLLQRVRELGADADGYLRKEAAASAVVERVREVLRARARVEQRVAAGGEVRGRLDGLTVRLLLELVRRGARDVRIAVRDAVYLWELGVRGGELCSITRSAPNGDFARGPGVLPGLLGVTAGRFSIEPDSSVTRNEFSAALPDILSEPVARARAALRAVSASALVRIANMTFDRASVQPYLTCTPQPALGLTRRLLEGASPRDLVLEGQADPRLLEAVLSDLARRGAIHSVEHEPGAGVFPAKAAPEPLLQAPGDDELDWDDELSEQDIAAAEGASPPEPTPQPEPMRVTGGGDMPFSQQLTPAVDWTSGPLFGFPEQGTLPGVGGAQLPDVEARPEPPAPTPSAPPAPESVHSLLPLDELAAAAAQAPPVTMHSSGPAAVTLSEQPPESVHSLLPLDELARVAAEGRAEPEPQPALPSVPTPPPEKVHSLLPLDELSSPPPDVEPDLSAVLAFGGSPSPPDVEIDVDQEPSPSPALFFGMRDEAREADLALQPGLASAPLTTEELLAAVTPPAPEVVAAPSAEKMPEVRKVESLHRTAMMDFGAKPKVEERPAERDEAEEVEESPAVSKAHSPEWRQKSVVPPPVSSREAATLPPTHAPQESSGLKTPVLALIGSAVAAFVLVQYVITPLFQKPETEAEPAVAVSVPLPAPKPTAVAAAPKSETLPLPTGIEVQSGLGLLEVEVSEPVALYVDGEFIGKGPLRRAPLQPGRHQLVIGEGEAGRTVTVDVTVGARTRVTLPAEPR
jgi:DNA-binding response OmpR family regulator